MPGRKSTYPDGLTEAQEKTITMLCQGYPVYLVHSRSMQALVRLGIVIDGELNPEVKDFWIKSRNVDMDFRYDPIVCAFDTLTSNQIKVMSDLGKARTVDMVCLEKKGLACKRSRGEWQLVDGVAERWPVWVKANQARVNAAFEAVVKKKPELKAIDEPVRFTGLLLLPIKYRKKLQSLEVDARAWVGRMLNNKPLGWEDDDLVSEVTRYIDACLEDRSTAA